MTTQIALAGSGVVSAVLLSFLSFTTTLAAQVHGPASSSTKDANIELDDSGASKLDGRRRCFLKGRVAASNQSTVVGRQIDELLDCALDRDPRTAVLDKAVAHFRTKAARAAALAKDDADFLICYRGFGPSSEAGDVITGEKLKLKSRGAAEYARQKHIDDLHSRIVADVLQIAMGLGMEDDVRGEETVALGLHSLSPLVGEGRALETMHLLSGWARQVKVPGEVFDQPVWDVQERARASTSIARTAAARDPVVVEIQNHLHKYNHLSKLTRASGSICNTVCGVMSRTPALHNAGTPALVGFVTATGGPEQSKIMKELYLDQRLASRKHVLNEESHMALDNYQIALMTRNPCLLACSESVIHDLAGPELVDRLFGVSVMPPGSTVTRSITKALLAADPSADFEKPALQPAQRRAHQQR